MIFNLNEQKVLSDPSGSSVFKGEKDFNDIVVNLPDNIDGHTATELNYVMHFVDSDGGYSAKILTVDSSGETLKATATVSTSITSKAQAFYAYVLMTDDEETVIGKTNGVIVMIHPVPDEENEIIPPADTDKIIKGLEEIVKEATETIETATDTIEEATEAISSKQDKLTAGENITISSDNVISAEDGGVTSYNDLTDKPTIIAANSATGWEISKTLEGVFDFRRFLYFVTESGKTSLQIKDNALSYEMLKSAFQKEIFKDYGYIDPPADFYTNYASAPAKNGIWEIFSQLEGAPTTLPHRLINYYSEGERIQFVITNPQDESFGKEQLFMRVQYMGNMGIWQELTGGSQIVSGVVNANGTITFTDSEGNSFTTSGESVIGADGFSPVATVTQTASGATVSITDKNGTTTANITNGQDGNDYVLTAQDKDDIADIVLAEFTGSIVNGELNTR